MSSIYQLKSLTQPELARWDELISPYATRQLFHSRAWLDYLAASRPIEIRYWSILENGRAIGYFCGGLTQKGPFRVLGSPLRGWGSNFMGPVVNPDFDQAAFLAALDRLAKEENIAMVEIENPVFAEEPVHADGFESVEQPTYIVSLTQDPEIMWKRIDVKSRQKVRKAKRNGVVVEEVDDPAIADEFYDQFKEVLARKNLFPPYDANCPRLSYRHLKPQDKLFSFKVTAPDGAIIAAGLFPHDDRTVYFWGGASRIAAWNYAPNDLLQWVVMEEAGRRGLQIYNMCGYGYFKSKFGGTLEHPRRWQKSYWRSARLARRGYELYFEKRIRFQGWWQRVTHPAKAPTAAG